MPFMVWYGMVWYGMVWYGVAGRGQLFCSKIFYMNTRVKNPTGIEKFWS